MMPYVATSRRAELDRGEFPQTCGELNYVLTRKLQGGVNSPREYGELLTESSGAKPTSYQSINDVIGAVNGALMEARRRGHHLPVASSALSTALLYWYHDVAGPYEDEKISQHGDVWT